MTKLKKLTIEQTKQLTKYQASKAQKLLWLGHCVNLYPLVTLSAKFNKSKRR